MHLLLPLIACTGPDAPGPVDIPTDDGTVSSDDTAYFTFDTAVDTGLNETPVNTLTFVQEGRWEMSPVGGPYTSAVGVFRVLEYQDDMLPPEDTGAPEEDPEEGEEIELPEGVVCEATFALTGQVVEGCPTCDFSFDFLFYVMDGDPELCQDTDMPLHGETRRYGFDVDAKTIYYDYGNSDLWLEWWHGTRQGDKVFFDWESTVGWIPPEEDD
jgi:hypothetical protein